MITGRISIYLAAFFAAIIICGGTECRAETVDPLSWSEGSGAGFTMADGGIRYYEPDGSFLKDSWVIIGPQAWCFDGDGYMITGQRQIDGKTWNLTYEGAVAVLGGDSGTEGDKEEDGGEYQYENEDGISGEEPDYSDSVIYNTVAVLLPMITTPEMTPDVKLRAAYDYVVNNTVYERTYDTPAGDWTASYAMDVFTTGKGNCYRYAAAFAYLAKALGFDSRVITGKIASRKGGFAPHGWVGINLSDMTYIFDPEMQYVKKTEKNYYCTTYADYPSKPLVPEAEWPVFF